LEREGMSAGASTAERIRELLNGIVDPCSDAAGNPMGLVDMGLIRNLRVVDAADGRVAVSADVRVTDPHCMMGAVFIGEVRKRLDALPGVASHEVKLSHEFDWTPDDVTGPGALRMREVRRALERRVPLGELRRAGERT
jgi:metal-sulfur cluster biosynthetic enzyme